MNLADKVTSTRLISAPVFFVVYFLPRLFPSIFAVPPPPGAESLHIVGPVWTVPVLWILFLGSELTDLLDGIIARKRREVSDFGKLFDPFADTLTQLTFFFCFVMDGILQPVLFLIMLYREFSILLIRNLMLKKGVTLGARMGGKIKTVSYVCTAGLALSASSLVRLGINGLAYRISIIAAKGVFFISVVVALVSFFDYLAQYLKTPKNQI